MKIVSATEGWSGRGLRAPPTGRLEDLAGWGAPIAAITDAGAEEDVPLSVPVGGEESSFYLLWITDLADSEGGFVVEIGEIELTG